SASPDHPHQEGCHGTVGDDEIGRARRGPQGRRRKHRCFPVGIRREPSDDVNQLALSATAIEVKPLRYTPAGLPAVELTLNHESQVQEAGHMRRVELDIAAVALGDIALLLADTPLGASLS